MSPKKIIRALLSVALTSSVLYGTATSSASAAVAAPATAVAAAAATPSDDSLQVTLITGDRLIVPDEGSAIVQPDPARTGIRFSSFSNHGQTYVIPSDALPALTAGELDYQLFSVTELLGSKFDAGKLPVIVQYAAGGESATRTMLSTGGATVTRKLSSVDSLAVTANEGTIGTLWSALTTEVTGGRRLNSTVDKIWLDRAMHTSLDQSVPQVGAPAAYAAGFDGTGAVAAVLDTGIDTNHPDLAGKVIAAANFTAEPDGDLVGHGTHVASTIAGSGAASQGRLHGVAPGAKLLSGKVCEVTGCDLSAIIAGMEWAAAQGADVVNMSLGGTDTPGLDPIEQALNDLTASTGTLFVVAAGNSPQTANLNSPGSADSALTVGAVDGSDNLASFSHRGPTADGGLKPDLTAPGVDITAARAGTQGYLDASGTSMATPHVAGGAAILHQVHPTWSAAELKSVLVGTAAPNSTLNAYEQGAGRLDIARAYPQTILAQPASLSLGLQRYPHNDDPVLPRTVTYRNFGTGAVTLNLALSTRGPSGSAAPAGMFQLSASSVTVPAGGQAAVTFTADTRVTAPDGRYTGAITATSTGVSVRTVFGVEREAESYDLTIDHISRQGFSTPAYFCLVQSADGNNFWLLGGLGPITVRLPRGTYMVGSNVFDGPDTSVLSAPRVELTQNRSMVMDARLAQPVSVTVADPQVTRFNTVVGVQMTGSGENAWLTSQVVGNAYTAQIGEQLVWGSVSHIDVTLADPNNNFFNSPRAYHLAWYTDQQLPTGFTRTVNPATLATVQATYAGHIPGSLAFKSAFPHPPTAIFGTRVVSALGVGLKFDLPFQRTEFYNTDGGVRWHGVLDESILMPGFITATNQLVSSVTAYAAGTTKQETWNRPVYGPEFTSSIFPQLWVVRRGNTIIADPPMTGDGDGHAGEAQLSIGSGTLRLLRNNALVAEAPFPNPSGVPAFTVPTGDAVYRLEATVNRAAPATLATKVSAAWTFRSDTVDANQYLRLPLWAVTFSPNTDLQGTAPAGRSFQIPLRAYVQPDAASSGLRTLTVDYSLNDGGTWQSATVATAADGTGTATVTHPSTTGFVSLRARAEDWAGNVVEQTVLRAYRIA